MRLSSALPLLTLALAACTFNTTVHPAKDAPNAPRTDTVLVVDAPPRGGVPMGTITVRGNRNMAGPACVAEAVKEARKLGATHLVVHPVESGAARGVRCTAEAYLLGAVV